MTNRIPYIRRSLPVPSKRVPTPVRSGNQNTQGGPVLKWSLPLEGSVIDSARPGIALLERAPAPR